MASALPQSIWRGRSVTVCKCLTILTSVFVSSISGSPAFKSRISAPASACSSAWREMKSVSPVSSAAFIAFLPVGLMRSPITFTPSTTTRFLAEHTADTRLNGVGCGLAASAISRSLRIYSGVVPQQPPTMRTPFSINPSHARANSSALTL